MSIPFHRHTFPVTRNVHVHVSLGRVPCAFDCRRSFPKSQDLSRDSNSTIFSLELCSRFQKASGGISLNTVAVIYPETPAAGLFAWYANGTSFREERDECSGTCRANINCYGKRASKRETRQKRVGGEGQDQKHLPKKQNAEGRQLLAGSSSAFSASVNNRWVGAAGNFLSPSVFLWIQFIKQFMWKVAEGYRGKILAESKSSRG